MDAVIERLKELISRTARFHSAVERHVESLVPAPGERYRVAFQAGLLALEHAVSARRLVEEALFSSAIALLRPQFESLVRGIWLLYAASDNWIAKFSEPLTLESAKRASEGEGLAEMLKQLEASPTAPKEVIGQLRAYKDVSWKAMNSYTHGGLHPLTRTLEGYPPQLLHDVIRNSNAIVEMTAQLQTILTGQPQNMAVVRRIRTEFLDILPVPTS